MAFFTLNPILFCPSCLSYLGPLEPACRCGWERPQPHLFPPEPDCTLWHASLPGPSRARPVPAGGMLLCPWGGRRGTGGVAALDRLTGEQSWAVETPNAVEGGVSLVEGKVYFGTLTHMGLGDGAQLCCLKLEDGEVLWKQPLSGGVWSAPVVREARIIIATDDGLVHCLDARSRLPLSGWPVRLNRGRIWLLEKGEQLVALNEHGQIALLRANAFGNPLIRSAQLGVFVSGTPAIIGGRVVFGGEGGMLLEVDLSDFALRVLAQDMKRVAAQPAIEGSLVFTGGHDRRLHAWELDLRKERWHGETLRSISASPALGEGLVAVADNGGRVYAFDQQSGASAWSFDLEGGQPALSGLAFHDGMFYVGDEGGGMDALPWHLGHYGWAGERLSSQKRFFEAGDAWALAAVFECAEDAQGECFSNAARNWIQANHPERAAALWESLDQVDKAAQVWRQAAIQKRQRDPNGAARCCAKAAELYFRLQDEAQLNDCTRMLARSAHLPFVEAKLMNAGRFTEYEAGELTLRLSNASSSAAEGLTFRLGGALKNVVEASIPERFEPNRHWTVPLTLVPTQENSILRIEYEFRTGSPVYPLMRGLFSIAIEARNAPAKPLQIGDVGMLQITVAGETLEGARIITKDVGMIRGAGINRVTVSGDAGAIVSRGGIDQLEVEGDAGLIKG